MLFFYVVYDNTTGTIKRSGNAYTQNELQFLTIDNTESVIMVDSPEAYRDCRVDLETRTLVRK